MLIRDIFKDLEEEEINYHDISVFLKNTPEKFTIGKSIAVSFTIHIILFGLALVIAEVLTYIFMLLGINLDLFSRPQMKIKDIEFVFVLPEKYNIKKSFTKIGGATNALAGPEPNNRPYNGDEGSLKSDLKDMTKAKNKVVNQRPLDNTNQVASQTTKPFSKKTKKGSYIPKVSDPGLFTANMPDTEMNTDIGWGTQGKSGYHSPTAGNASIKGSGSGSGGSGSGDSVGNGTVKGGGYVYGKAGAPRPQTGSSYKNEAADVDLRPYATELQRRVLRNWSMPKNDRKTVLFIRISKTGNLMILNIKSPSGDTYTDELAVSAVKKAQPFSPLPVGYKNAYADFILTIGYNVSARAN